MGGNAKNGRVLQNSEVVPVAKAFVETIGFGGDQLCYVICGSYRRGAPVSKDIDLVLCYDTPDEKVAIDAALILEFGCLKTDPSRPKKTGLFDGVQIDIHVCNGMNVGSMLLHTTGSWQFNQFLRTMAIRKGLKLNQYGIFDRETDECLFCSQFEENIMEYLKVRYVEPRKRSVGCLFPIDDNGQEKVVMLTERGFYMTTANVCSDAI